MSFPILVPATGTGTHDTSFLPLFVQGCSTVKQRKSCSRNGQPRPERIGEDSKSESEFTSSVARFIPNVYRNQRHYYGEMRSVANKPYLHLGLLWCLSLTGERQVVPKAVRRFV